ncbi:hypothetical protein TIFTF001_004274 [Ficus carica]|uniref:Uncharacterized protein n=1 Tax=Ficus carica TaxID=3494 RepID=A0AA87ZFJ2_FICCA|nr:hypothetical protein TIFTF001_004274 [Ficus carica]
MTSWIWSASWLRRYAEIEAQVLGSSSIAKLRSHGAIEARRARRSPPSQSPKIDRLRTSSLRRGDPRIRLEQPRSRDSSSPFFVVVAISRRWAPAVVH